MNYNSNRRIINPRMMMLMMQVSISVKERLISVTKFSKNGVEIQPSSSACRTIQISHTNHQAMMQWQWKSGADWPAGKPGAVC